MKNTVQSTKGVNSVKTKLSKTKAENMTFTEILSSLLPEDATEKAKAEEAIKGIEQALSSDGSFKGCVEGYRSLMAVTTKHKEVFKTLKKAVKKSYSTSFVARYLHAVKITAEHPVLMDIVDKERLSIIARIPEERMEEIISVGIINGMNIRTENRKKLRDAVAALKGKKAEQTVDQQNAGFVKSLENLIGRMIVSEHREVIRHLSAAITALEKSSNDTDTCINTAEQVSTKAPVRIGFNDDDADEYSNDDNDGEDPEDNGDESADSEETAEDADIGNDNDDEGDGEQGEDNDNHFDEVESDDISPNRAHASVSGL